MSVCFKNEVLATARKFKIIILCVVVFSLLWAVSVAVTFMVMDSPEFGLEHVAVGSVAFLFVVALILLDAFEDTKQPSKKGESVLVAKIRKKREQDTIDTGTNAVILGAAAAVTSCGDCGGC